jgi:hypothetical protein
MDFGIPQRVLAVLDARFDTRQDRYLAPEESTVRRLTQQIDGDLLDAAISGWLTQHLDAHPTIDLDLPDTAAAGQPTPPAAVAVDRKSLRDTFGHADGAGAHLLAAISHTTGTDRTDGIVLTQRQMEQKTSEITWFAPMLDQIDLTGVGVTADTLHTTRDHARYLVERGEHYVFTIKEPASPPRPARLPASARDPHPHP